ncbi:MAG: hypothetical protein V3V61_07675 [Gammaproteobacteria bacterium]
MDKIRTPLALDPGTAQQQVITDTATPLLIAEIIKQLLEQQAIAATATQLLIAEIIKQYLEQQVIAATVAQQLIAEIIKQLLEQHQKTQAFAALAVLALAQQDKKSPKPAAELTAKPVQTPPTPAPTTATPAPPTATTAPPTATTAPATTATEATEATEESTEEIPTINGSKDNEHSNDHAALRSANVPGESPTSSLSRAMTTLHYLIDSSYVTTSSFIISADLIFMRMVDLNGDIPSLTKEYFPEEASITIGVLWGVIMIAFALRRLYLHRYKDKEGKAEEIFAAEYERIRQPLSNTRDMLRVGHFAYYILTNTDMGGMENLLINAGILAFALVYAYACYRYRENKGNFFDSSDYDRFAKYIAPLILSALDSLYLASAFLNLSRIILDVAETTVDFTSNPLLAACIAILVVFFILGGLAKHYESKGANENCTTSILSDFSKAWRNDIRPVADGVKNFTTPVSLIFLILLACGVSVSVGYFAIPIILGVAYGFWKRHEKREEEALCENALPRNTPSDDSLPTLASHSRRWSSFFGNICGSSEQQARTGARTSSRFSPRSTQ